MDGRITDETVRSVEEAEKKVNQELIAMFDYDREFRTNWAYDKKIN